MQGVRLELSTYSVPTVLYVSIRVVKIIHYVFVLKLNHHASNVLLQTIFNGDGMDLNRGQAHYFPSYPLNLQNK